MRTRKVTRITAQYPGQRGVWFGTCPTWARGIPADATVRRETVVVVNPTQEACAVPRCPTGSHVRLPAPT